MSVSANLAEHYNNNITDFRKLFKLCLVENSSTETIDIKATEERILAITRKKEEFERVSELTERNELLNVLRPKVMAFLNKVFFSMNTISDKWWYEFFHRIEKLVTIMVFVERENLLSFTDKTDLDDCPQSLAYLTEKIEKFKKTKKPKMKRKYIELMNSLNNTVVGRYVKKKSL